jgi:hypothetical protein
MGLHKPEEHIRYSVELLHNIFGVLLEMFAFTYSNRRGKRGRMAKTLGMATLSEFTATETLASESEMDVHNNHCT